LLPSCVNGGGAASLLRLPGTPGLDREFELGSACAAALLPWRLRPGAIMTAVDPHNSCYRLRLTAMAPAPRGVPFARLARPAESPLAIEVYQALPEKERFELLLQKLTELGVTRIVPVETARSVTLAERDAIQRKSHRWPEVVRRAAIQCRRAMLPELYAPMPLAPALALAGAAGLKLIMYEGEAGLSIAAALGSQRPPRVAVLVGPEGGFAPAEVAAARAAGFGAVTLGPRILRTETAAMAAAALLQGLAGDLA
jgi:16S rRNA (uracil1498-N3)-methyltransferase